MGWGIWACTMGPVGVGRCHGGLAGFEGVGGGTEDRAGVFGCRITAVAAVLPDVADVGSVAVAMPEQSGVAG